MMKIGIILAAILAAFATVIRAAEPLPNSTRAVLTTVFQQPQTKFFTLDRDAAGKWTSGHADSYYLKTVSKDIPVFVAGNDSFLAQMKPDGSLGQTCVFSGDTIRDGERRKYPGGWVTWKRETAPAPSLEIGFEGKVIHPSTDWPVHTSFILNAIPTAEYTSPKLGIRLVACAPISSDGLHRPRGLIWGIMIRNLSSAAVEGTLGLSACKGLAVQGLNSRTAFRLAPGAESWFPVLLTRQDDKAAMDELSRRDAADWLAETCSYWRRVTGTFAMSGDPFTAELFTRCSVLALQSGVFNGHGHAVGVLYGLSPYNGADNFRDSYYAILPAASRDPAYLRPFIPWFNQYSTRPVEQRHPRGVLHSLGNTLDGVILAGLYYQATADKKLFAENPELVKGLRETMETILATHKTDQPWLFGSSYISDGRSLGDWHTGSNVCAWRAFSSFAAILEDACGDPITAARYREIAAKIKTDLDGHNIMPNGPYRPQYVEGTNADGNVPAMIHDGEESDTTLMPFYGYCAAGFPAYHNYMRFAASPQNVAFNPETRGIVWESYGANAKVRPVGPLCAGATFPGYITALAGCTDKESLHGRDGYLTEIRRLTDVNGTLWWWPYRPNSKRGQDMQRGPFECGWAEGVFAAMFPANFLGLQYDAPKHTLTVAPLPYIGDFEWTDFPIGFDHFTVLYKNGLTTVTNLTSHPVAVAFGNSSPVLVQPGKSVAAKS